MTNINNKHCSHQEHPGVPDGPHGTDGTSNSLTVNQSWPVAQTTARIAYLPSGGYNTMSVPRVTHCGIYHAAPESRLIYFSSRMWWHICTIRTTCVLHYSQRLQWRCSHFTNNSRCWCISPARCHISHLRYCNLLDAALSHICSTLTSCHLSQYSLPFRLIAGCSIHFTIIVFYKPEIYWPIVTLSTPMLSVSSTMPSVLQILL